MSKQKILITLIIILAILTIIAVVFYLPKPQDSGESASIVNIPAEPDIVYKRSGEIISINPETQTIVIQSRIRTETEATTENLENAFETKELTITVNENTKYIIRDFALVKSGDPVPEAQETNFTELKVGDTVNVTGVENVKGLLEFVAGEVEIIISR